MAVTKLFIGSSSAAKSQAKKFVEAFSSHTLKFVPWYESITPGQVLLDELDSIYRKVDGAVLIFSPESETKIRKDKKQSPNLNVLFEFGCFLGAYERNKIAMVKYGDFYLPSDFGGYQWIHGSSGFRRGGIQAISQRTKNEFGRWLENFWCSITTRSRRTATPPLNSSVRHQQPVRVNYEESTQLSRSRSISHKYHASTSGFC